MNPTLQNNEIERALLNLEAWVLRSGWKAYDTFDGLSSPLAPILTLGNPFLRQVWQQGVRRFPVNLRPLLGIKPSMSTKGMGFFAQGYLRLYQTHGNVEHLNRMRYCLNWLLDNRNKSFKGYCWGNHFDYQARSGRISKGIPTVVWTGLIGHAFLDAFEAFQDAADLEVAGKICEFITDELGWVEFPEGWCIRYYPVPQSTDIHNSNVIGASLLARAGKHLQRQDYSGIARKAVQFTVHHQLQNGGWYYGADPKHHWVDLFHTGYVLESIAIYNRYSGDSTFEESLRKGFKFFVETFFAADGTPRYYDYKTRPLDIQCASQGIQTLVNLRDLHPQSLNLAVKVAHWTIANMQDPTGYFYYRKYPLITNKTPTLHWGQATMFAALALLDHCLDEKSSRAKLVGQA
jgi:hypothetical protein